MCPVVDMIQVLQWFGADPGAFCGITVKMTKMNKVPHQHHCVLRAVSCESATTESLIPPSVLHGFEELPKVGKCTTGCL